MTTNLNSINFSILNDSFQDLYVPLIRFKIKDNQRHKLHYRPELDFSLKSIIIYNI